LYRHVINVTDAKNCVVLKLLLWQINNHRDKKKSNFYHFQHIKSSTIAIRVIRHTR